MSVSFSMLAADMLSTPQQSQPAPVYGTTAKRPVMPIPWTMYGDTDLDIPIWWNGINWVDATGAIV